MGLMLSFRWDVGGGIDVVNYVVVIVVIVITVECSGYIGCRGGMFLGRGNVLRLFAVMTVASGSLSRYCLSSVDIAYRWVI